MKPARFAYHRPHQLDDAVALLGELGDEAKVLAGGQSLLAMMNFRLARPEHLVDIGRIDGLRGISRSDAGIRIGALTTHYEVECSLDPAFERDYAILRDAMQWIGHVPIRTRGTVGGSLAHADAVAEWCLLAVLLGAEIAITGSHGDRVVAAAEFLQGFFTTALDADEIVTAVTFPRPAPSAALAEFAHRRGDTAVVAAAVDLEVEGDRIVTGRVAVAGLHSVPVRVPGAEAALAGRLRGTAAEFADVGDAVVAALDPPDDGTGTGDHRRRLAREMTIRACVAAARRRM